MPMATDHASLLMLLNWMSPTFPIGSFAYSHGLEQAIVDGRVSNAAEVEDWIADLLQRGSGWTENPPESAEEPPAAPAEWVV